MQSLHDSMEKVPTAYNDFLKNDKLIIATEQELVEFNAHLQRFIAEIRSAKALGMILLT
jgi:hypothetical protein